MCNIAVVSVHTSPLARPGTRDSGGMNVYIRELSRQMGRRAHTMDIFTRRTDPDTPEITIIDERTRVIQVSAGPFGASKGSLRRHVGEFTDNVLAFHDEHNLHYDLIHSNYWLSGIVGMGLKAEWGIPHVAMFHTLAEAKNRHHPAEREPAYRVRGEMKVASNADQLICASEGEKDLLISAYGASRENVSVVPCGVDTLRFRPMKRDRVRCKLGLPDDEPIVLFVGRIEPLKGIDVLVQAMACLETEARLLVVGGDGKDVGRKAQLMELAAGLGIADRVTFLDAVPHSDLPLYYNAADVCVVPSYYESFGMVALEAMACGVPVVVSRVAGLKETVRDGRTGYLVPWRCPEPFAERLELLLSNEPLRRKLGREARAEAERFRWSEVATQVEDVYHDLVSESRGVAVGAHVA
jgi:D-inositol-3-phosphate glycosyltransferase